MIKGSGDVGLLGEEGGESVLRSRLKSENPEKVGIFVSSPASVAVVVAVVVVVDVVMSALQ